MSSFDLLDRRFYSCHTFLPVEQMNLGHDKILDYKFLFWLPVLTYLLLSAIYMLYGSFWLDEEFYLMACREVYRGKLLYRDFGYTQTPLFPYLYGLFLKPFGYHLIAGRFISFLFSLGTFIVSLLVAYRFGGKRTLFFTVWFIGFNPLVIFFLTTITTNALIQRSGAKTHVRGGAPSSARPARPAETQTA